MYAWQKATDMQLLRSTRRVVVLIHLLTRGIEKGHLLELFRRMHADYGPHRIRIDADTILTMAELISVLSTTNRAKRMPYSWTILERAAIANTFLGQYQTKTKGVAMAAWKSSFLY